MLSFVPAGQDVPEVHVIVICWFARLKLRARKSVDGDVCLPFFICVPRSWLLDKRLAKIPLAKQFF